MANLAQIITLQFFLHTFFCSKKSAETLFYSVFWKQCLKKTNLAQIITVQKAKLGPDNNSTAYIYISPHVMGRYSAFLAFLPSFIAKMPTTYSHWKVAVNLFFSFLVFLFFCLFLTYFSLFLCFYKSQSLKIAHQLRCAAYIYIYVVEIESGHILAKKK